MGGLWSKKQAGPTLSVSRPGSPGPVPMRNTRPLRCRATASFSSVVDAMASRKGLTLVYFSAQLEPCLSQENTLHALNQP